jgi:hypothetical protein
LIQTLLLPLELPEVVPQLLILETALNGPGRLGADSLQQAIPKDQVHQAGRKQNSGFSMHLAKPKG